MKIKNNSIIVLCLLTLVSCEGSKPARMIDTVEKAVEAHNNGDSTMLIILIIGAIVFGGIWIYSKKDKL